MSDLAQRARDLDRHVFHSWSAQGGAAGMTIAGGAGTRIWDYDGREYLDFSSQLVNVNIGYGHPRVVEAIQRQAAELATIGPATVNLARGEAAERILERAGGEFEKVFFTNGGADANENAMRMARLVTGRDKILSHYRSYHGNTGAAIAATGDWRRVPNEFSRGHVHFFGPYAYRSEFWADSPEQESERALEHLERVVAAEGGASIAAILLEGIPGTAGILVPPAGYLDGVREICDANGILLILDEVMSGFGRAGEWFSWHSEETNPRGIVPDIVTFAKGVNSGYVPIGGVLPAPHVADRFSETVFPGGLTYSGHPLAAASIVAALDAMTEERIVENARRIGSAVIGPGLREIAERRPIIGDVRGLGVFWAVELVADRATREPVPDAAVARVKALLLDRGVIAFTAANRIHVVPPCTVSEAEVGAFLTALDGALAALGAPEHLEDHD
ncbi:aspartate aminotransferase family protein [Microbacterium suaedae]|uniref:aspartate aminotransferase family protein n=1 Tax=Microbacterium suaedae TaxID=2067813 RepID=UPI000DABEB3E|nr:aspartate aminotransferase family protein [Microbacterium suaedae]